MLDSAGRVIGRLPGRPLMATTACAILLYPDEPGTEIMEILALTRLDFSPEN